ncbi:MAG: hypothetical protein M3176_07405 [Chloroflexota bacterium]|nr:hypothetical protein [Chloroflexota bacterium]MDQ6906636.1 hypothetical protein [Chloroflexota bacterium]
MTKRQKREDKIRRNPKQVGFDEINTVMTNEGFDADINGSHCTYEHRDYADLRTTVVIPHGGSTHVLPVYVGNALAILDEARRRQAKKEAGRNA